MLPVLIEAIPRSGLGGRLSQLTLILAQFQEKLLSYYQLPLQERNFKDAVKLANELAGILSTCSSIRTCRVSKCRVGKHLAVKVESQSNRSIADTLDLQHSVYRAAGNNYAKMRSLNFPHLYYTEFVWKSAENSRMGLRLCGCGKNAS